MDIRRKSVSSFCLHFFFSNPTSRYVAKIIFTYILGYKVDIGHMEAVNLIASPKYSEKQIVCVLSLSPVSVRHVVGLQGYLAVTLLMHENSDFLRLVVNSIRKDLDSNNEVDNCLALHAIANVGGSEMAEALVEDVHRLLISLYVSFFFRQYQVANSCPVRPRVL
jgi:AP-2 complex subunit alpha